MDQNKLNEIAFKILNSALLGEITEVKIFDDLIVNVAEFENEVLELEFTSKLYYANFKVSKDLNRLSVRLKESLNGYNYGKHFNLKISNDGSGYYVMYKGDKRIIKANMIDNMVNPYLFLDEDYTQAFKYAENDNWIKDAVKYMQSKEIVPDDSTFNIGDVQISIGDEFKYAHIYMDDIAGYIKFEENNISLEDAVNKLLNNKYKIERIHKMTINRFIGTKFVNFTNSEITVEDDDTNLSNKIPFEEFIKENELPEELQLFLHKKSLELETDNVTNWIKEHSVEITEEKIKLKDLVILKDEDLLYFEKKNGRFAIQSENFSYKNLFIALSNFYQILEKNDKRYNEISQVANRPDSIIVSLKKNSDEIYVDNELNNLSKFNVKRITKFKR